MKPFRRSMLSSTSSPLLFLSNTAKLLALVCCYTPTNSFVIAAPSFIARNPFTWFSKNDRYEFDINNQVSSSSTKSVVAESTTPTWDPIQQIYVGGVVPENEQVQKLLQQNNGYLRIFGYGSLCWNPGTGTLSRPQVTSTLGKAIGYQRCWAQKSTDHRGRPNFPGIVCTLLKDQEVQDITKNINDDNNQLASKTEGMIFLVPPDIVPECLQELDFREKGGYARDVITVMEDGTGKEYQALLYRGTPDNPAFWSRALLDLPYAAAIMAVADGPSGKNDYYLNSLNEFLFTANATQDTTVILSTLTQTIQDCTIPYFLFGCGSNQHNQLLLQSENNAAGLVNNGEDAHERKEIVVFAKSRTTTNKGEKDSQRPEKIFGGGGHSGLLTQDGCLYLWGWNQNGQLGRSSSNTNSNNDINNTDDIIINVSNTTIQLSCIPKVSINKNKNNNDDLIVEDAALGFAHTLIVAKDSGYVYGCGDNDRGQVNPNNNQRNNNMITTMTKVQHIAQYVDEKKDPIIALGAGLFHSAAITSSGSLLTWGCDKFGQCLVASLPSSPCIQSCWKPSDNVKLMQVVCGRRHTVMIDELYRIWTMGDNKYGQLGRQLSTDITTTAATTTKPPTRDATPGMVELDLGLYQKRILSLVVDCGWSHCIALVTFQDDNINESTRTTTTKIYGWGRNDKGQLGSRTSTKSITTPIEIFSDNASNVKSIACGSESTMLLMKDGTICGCGWNEHGNLGIGTKNVDNDVDDCLWQLSPMQGAPIVCPPGRTGDETILAAGGAHVLAMKI